LKRIKVKLYIYKIITFHFIELLKNIRDSYHKNGKLFKIGNKLPLPQIKIGSLIISYPEFTILNETGYLDKILNGITCHHLRIFNNTIVYAKSNNYEEETICIYCYSLKKKKQVVCAISNWRDYSDEENNEILSFCEKNEITIKLIDNQNPYEKPLPTQSNSDKMNSLISSNQKFVIIDDEIFPFQDFYLALEKKFANKSSKGFKCTSCGKALESSASSLKKCFDCLMLSSSSLSSFSNSGNATITISSENKSLIKLNLSEGSNSNLADNQIHATTSHNQVLNRKNPYNFMEKLKLKKQNFLEKEIENASFSGTGFGTGFTMPLIEGDVSFSVDKSDEIFG
jgi:hypothetical protein